MAKDVEHVFPHALIGHLYFFIDMNCKRNDINHTNACKPNNILFLIGTGV
jgi:hypothetical protein